MPEAPHPCQLHPIRHRRRAAAERRNRRHVIGFERMLHPEDEAEKQRAEHRPGSSHGARPRTRRAYCLIDCGMTDVAPMPYGPLTTSVAQPGFSVAAWLFVVMSMTAQAGSL